MPIGDAAFGIDRHRLNQDEARNQFLSSSERTTVLSSRISKKRLSYQQADRRRRKNGEDIINEVNVSSDEEAESLERKLTRLRREVLEVQEHLMKQNSTHGGSPTNDPELVNDNQEIDSLRQLLDNVSGSVESGAKTIATRLCQRLDPNYSIITNETPTAPKIPNEVGADIPIIPSPDNQTDSGLSMIADFDSRLRHLEITLGIDALPLPTQDQISAKPLLPALDTLDKQINALATSTDISLEKIKGRVRELGQEAENLERKRSQAKRAMEVLGPSNTRPTTAATNGEASGLIIDDAELMSKINALYGTLNTIESLAPLLPLVLDRLRSLKDLHTEAATAGQSLSRIESKQEDMKQELQGWRDGLEKAEKAMQQGQDTMKGNTEVIEGWVKDLEERLMNLG